MAIKLLDTRVRRYLFSKACTSPHKPIRTRAGLTIANLSCSDNEEFLETNKLFPGRSILHQKVPLIILKLAVFIKSEMLREVRKLFLQISKISCYYYRKSEQDNNDRKKT